MGWWRPLIDSVTQVLVVGAGNSIGREGAPRLTAGAVSAYIGRWLKLEQHSVAYLIAAGAGAGLASVYNTPLGGAAYAVEIVLIAGMRRRGLLFALPVSVIATVVAWLGNHNAPTYTTPDITLSWGDLLGALLLIPITLGLGLVSRTLWMWAKDRRVEQGLLLPLTIGLAGACTGVASIWLPMVPGNGKDAMQVALTSPGTQAALLMLLAVVVLKPLLTGATLGAGATGGLLTPSLAAGASAGAALAYGLQYAGLDANIALLAFIGAGAVLAVTQKAPWFGVLFTWELIQGPWWSLLLIAAVVTCVWQLATRLNQSHTRRRKITESQP